MISVAGYDRAAKGARSSSDIFVVTIINYYGIGKRHFVPRYLALSCRYLALSPPLRLPFVNHRSTHVNDRTRDLVIRQCSSMASAPRGIAKICKSLQNNRVEHHGYRLPNRVFGNATSRSRSCECTLRIAGMHACTFDLLLTSMEYQNLHNITVVIKIVIGTFRVRNYAAER